MPKENPFDSSCCAITVLWNATKAAMESYQSLPSTSLENLSAITSGVLRHGCTALMGFPRDSISLISLTVPVGCPIWQVWVKLQEHPPSKACAGSLDGSHLPGMHLEWPDCAMPHLSKGHMTWPIHLPLPGWFQTWHAALEGCSAPSSVGSMPSFQYRMYHMPSSFTRVIHKATWKVKEVYSEVITTVHWSNPLAEKIQEGFAKEAAVWNVEKSHIWEEERKHTRLKECVVTEWSNTLRICRIPNFP